MLQTKFHCPEDAGVDEAALEAEKTQLTTTMFHRAIESDPANGNAHLRMGEFLNHIGDPQVS